MTINEARELAAQCWCKESTKGKVMDVELAEVFAQTLVEQIEKNDLEWQENQCYLDETRYDNR